jgi:hypothetical protein
MISFILTQSLPRPHRQPRCKNPADYGMKFQDVEFSTIIIVWENCLHSLKKNSNTL